MEFVVDSRESTLVEFVNTNPLNESEYFEAIKYEMERIFHFVDSLCFEVKILKRIETNRSK
jgi:hypothetical protein